MPEWLSIFSFWLALAVMLVGLYGLLIPLFPGVFIIWAAALVYGLVHGFGVGGWIVFGVLTVLLIAATTLDNVAMGVGAHRGGAPWFAIIIALIVGFIAGIFLSPLGGLLAIPITLFLLEIIRLRDWRKTLASLRGLAVGYGMAFFVRFFFACLMILIWVIWAISRR